MLLEDSLQKKWGFAIFGKHIKKGELIERNSDGQWIVAGSEPLVLVECQQDQTRYVNTKIVQYLVAVENLDSRYNLLINEYDSLKNNLSLKVGDKVDVMMEQKLIPISGVVRYKGSLLGKKGIFFGIEIVVSY